MVMNNRFLSLIWQKLFDDDNLVSGMGGHLIQIQYLLVIEILSQCAKKNFAMNVYIHLLADVIQTGKLYFE